MITPDSDPTLVNLLLGLGQGTALLLIGFAIFSIVEWGWRLLKRFNRWAWPLPTNVPTPAPVYPTPELAEAFARLEEHDRQIDAIKARNPEFWAQLDAEFDGGAAASC